MDPGTALADFPWELTLPAAGSEGGVLYVLGEIAGAKKLTGYDPSANVWSPLPDAPAVALPDARLVAYAGKLYAIQGTALWSFDPAVTGHDAWQQEPPLPSPGDNYRLAAAAGELFVVYDGQDGARIVRFGG